jgi:hypothetical protein
MIEAMLKDNDKMNVLFGSFAVRLTVGEGSRIARNTLFTAVKAIDAVRRAGSLYTCPLNVSEGLPGFVSHVILFDLCSIVDLLELHA